MLQLEIRDIQLLLRKSPNSFIERVVKNIGGHYKNVDGIFVAPKKGMYLFAWTVCTYIANYVMTELMADNTMISSAGEQEGSGTYCNCGSITAVCRMDKDKHA